MPSLQFGLTQSNHDWHFEQADGTRAHLAHQPRLVSDDMATLYNAALHGVGIAVLPGLMIQRDIEAGRLVEILPQWRPKAGTICAVFPSRRGLLPAMRVLLNFLAEQMDHLRDEAAPALRL